MLVEIYPTHLPINHVNHFAPPRPRRNCEVLSAKSHSHLPRLRLHITARDGRRKVNQLQQATSISAKNLPRHPSCPCPNIKSDAYSALVNRPQSPPRPYS